jgi:phosphoglycolate phosphatase-like HAD superfamily hydrolase
MNKILLFDFDGTIVDSIMSVFEVTNQLSEKYGFKKIEAKDIERLRGNSAKDILKELNISLFKIPFIGKDIKDNLRKKVVQLQPIKGLKEVLRELKEKGYILGILTSNGKENVEAFLKKQELEIFTYIYSDSSIFGKDKVLNSFLKKNNVAKEDVIYVGDEIRDIQACQKAHIPIIAVTWGFNTEAALKKYHPDFLIQEPKKLTKILSKISS